MRELMLWVQPVQGLSWVGVVALLIFGMPSLLMALSKFLVVLTAIRSSDPERRESACRVLESLNEPQPVRSRRRRGKNS